MRITFLILLFFTSLIGFGGELSVYPAHPLIDGIENTFNLEYEIGSKDSVKIELSDKHFYLVNDSSIKTTCKESFDSDQLNFTIVADGEKMDFNFNAIPKWLSFLPLLIAIFIAVIRREVLLALFVAIACGAAILGGYGNFSGETFRPEIEGEIVGPLWRYFVDIVVDADHFKILAFTLLIGLTVKIISDTNSITHFIDQNLKRIKSRSSALLSIYFSGLVVFFDDYANTMVLGNAFRKLADKFNISREKLAYIVDSTAAPIAAIAIISTWVGFEISQIEEANKSEGLQVFGDLSGYQVFLQTIPYSFYPIFTLVFVFLISKSERDFGPMKTAELHSLEKPEDLTDGTISVLHRWKLMLMLIPMLVIFALSGLIYSGWDEEMLKDSSNWFEGLMNIVGNANSYKVLSFTAAILFLISILIFFFDRNKREFQLSVMLKSGVKQMSSPLLILILAWSIGLISQDLQVHKIIHGIINDFDFSIELVPVVIFITSAAIALATGSSWTTMALVIPLSVSVLKGFVDVNSFHEIYFLTIASVLGGAVLGDHCSPISDTTVLSSIATGCDHMKHVRTQLPYAIVVGMVTLLCGIVPAAYGFHPVMCLILAVIIMVFIVYVFGRKKKTA